ncbi:protein jag [Ornithinicoccus hortensis]|uniref:SpoIIIJ-associated protein n=1 Tax=Ornithinicoccus hortensis TaxID=82346 RepID=A0A542YMW9_9MICO|nr:R3H domain-containing nucleic acid-binding protein [Ornithinicoccus hortensis]TQL49435.1 spoIIIJ-associated protein [Ornithinicoccus hortensis]
MSTPAETSQDDVQDTATDATSETEAAAEQAHHVTTTAEEAGATDASVSTEATEGTDAADVADVADAADVADGPDATDTTEGTEVAPRRRPSRKVAELEREGEIAADFLETLLDIADLDGDLEVDVEADRAAVAIVDSEDGPAPQRLVGKEAAVLEALQELTRLAVQAETGERSRLMLDIAGHRAARRAALVEQARQVIGEVKNSGGRQELEPMTAFERKVVHDEVLAAGLTSESEGDEPNRYVVVLPAD